MFLKILFRTTVAYLLVGFFLYAMQDFLVFPRVSDKFFDPGNNYQKLPAGIKQTFVTTSDNHNIDVWTTYSAEKKTEYAAIIFHGNNETVASRNFLPFFNKLGIAAFSFDYRGYGKSSGWPSEQGLYTDTLAVYEHVKKITSLPDEKIILLGNSIGTGFASYLGKNIKPAAIILLAPYYTFRDLILDRAIYAPFVFFLRYHMPTAEYLKNIDNSCMIIAHGKNDNVIPFSHSERILDELKSKKKVLLASDSAGHNDLFYAVEDDLKKELSKCLNS